MNKYHLKQRKQLFKSDMYVRTTQKIGNTSVIPITDIQIDLIDRIMKVREIVDGIDRQKKILIYGAEDHSVYLFSLTDILKYNIIGIVDHSDVTILYDYFHNKEYKVLPFDNETLIKADIILISDFYNIQDKKEKLYEVGFSGTVMTLYSEEDCMPFFHIPDYNVLEKTENSSDVFNKMKYYYSRKADEHYLDVIKRIDKINKKLEKCENSPILVYGVGAHTDLLFRLTDISKKNVKAFADRSVREYKGNKVRGIEKESFEDVDWIVISSFMYQNEIKNYLEGLSLASKILCLYDDDDKKEFTFNLNSFTPDRLDKDFSKKYSEADVRWEMERVSDGITRKSDCLVDYKVYPDNLSISASFYTHDPEVIRIKSYDDANSKSAIIIQGPISWDDSFTYNTILLYKRIFPGTCIILSTWNSEKNHESFKDFEDIGIEIVLSDPPEQKGLLNVNYQIKSTFAGINRAKELGYNYALKTRTDFRIYADGCISYIYKMIKKYPSDSTEREKLGVLPAFLDRPYYISDFLMYGNVDDLLRFWAADELLPNVTNDGTNPEMLLYSRYFRRIGKYIDDAENHLESYIDVLCTDFVITDPDLYRFFWKKYTYEQYHESPINYGRRNSFQMIDWLCRVVCS